MKKILFILILLLLTPFLSVEAGSGWLYAENDDFNFPYRYGQHVLTFGDSNGYAQAVSAYKPLKASGSEMTTLFTVRRVYEQKELKQKLEDIGLKSKIKGISKQLVENKLDELYAPGKRYILLSEKGIVYEIYIPKMQSKTEQYWFDQAVFQTIFK